MKIIQLKSENFKGIKAVEITPDANFQIISGKNEQGKSSVLDAIWAAVGGQAGSKELDKPIRNGQEKAFVTVDLGGLVITRKWKGDNSTLEVVAKDGAKYGSPQKMLDEMIGKLSFDPLSFANQDAKSQKATLQDLVGLNFDELDRERKNHFDDRTVHNRQVDRLKGVLSSVSIPELGTPTEEVSASDIIKELTAAQTQINLNSRKRQELDNMRQNANGMKAEIEQLEERLTRKKEELAAIQLDGMALKAEVESLVDPDTTAIQAKLENVESTNKKVSQAAQYRKLKAELKEYENLSDACTNEISKIDKKKTDSLQNAKFPVEGLSFDENGVTYNQIPFGQCSSAQRWKVSVATAMSLNPKLRVIRIIDGSLLDSVNMKIVEEMARENDYQVWIERVDESGNVGIVIEDGQVKSHGLESA